MVEIRLIDGKPYRSAFAGQYAAPKSGPELKEAPNRVIKDRDGASPAT
jgi:hypothetical protein